MKFFFTLLFSSLVCLSSNAQVKELWGMTSQGGQYSAGLIFKTDGSGNNETVQQNFVVQTEGANPKYSNLLQATDGKLYGMTENGGANGMGVLFQYDPATSTYTKKFDFGVTNGKNPLGSLMQASDGKIYGMTANGGTNDRGVLFQYDPTTSIYIKKLDFDGIATGSNPYGFLVQATDGMFYGLTHNGGTNGMGVLFQYNPATNSCIKKFDFAGAANGSYPIGSLKQASDGMLYGMTSQGGTYNFGVLFQYDPATDSYTKKLDFSGATNGSYPSGSLMQASDGKLYGMTSEGGISAASSTGVGVLFQYDPSSSTYTKKFDFVGGVEGGYPIGSLMQASDGKFYGMAQGGANNMGVLFQYDPVSSSYIKKLDFAGSTNGNEIRGTLMQASDGKLYGTTYLGGTYGAGVLFQYDPATSSYIKKLDFAEATNGSNPYGSLMQASDGKLYGMTSEGGANGMGVLFEFDPDSHIYTKKHDFAGGRNGSNPNSPGSLIQTNDGKLYGMTYWGGENSNGTIFQYDPYTNIYIDKIDFNWVNGEGPKGSLMQASDGKLYGMTSGGGAYGVGVLFQYDPATNTYIKKINFSNINGSNPHGSLMQASDGKLYGMTFQGGANDLGVLFQYNPITSAYAKKLDFNGINGSNPYGALIQANDGKLYGMTSSGGTDGSGVIFQYDPTSDTYAKKLDFAGHAGGNNPTGSLIQASDGKLYGMTWVGGANNAGILFQYDPTTSIYIKKLDFNVANGKNPYYTHLIEINAAALLCSTDINSDGVTSQTDLNLLYFKFGTSCTCNEDINHDGIVSQADINLLYIKFGASCH